MSTEDLPPVVLSNPLDIRALAHPARMAVIEELYSGREMTATECAAIAGLSPSAMSYHLRSLERAGIVVRADSGGDARERPWRAAGGYLQVKGGTGPGELAASAALSSTVLGRTIEGFEAWLDQRATETDEWRQHGGATSGQVWLTPDEAKELQQQFLEATDRYRHRQSGARPDDARRVRFALLVFPADPAPADQVAADQVPADRAQDGRT